MIARHAFGGTLETQAWVGISVIITTGGLAMAIYNIKRLQIDQHRAWMLRTWFYVSSSHRNNRNNHSHHIQFATIITLRIIMVLGAMIISTRGGYYMVQPCIKIADMVDYDNKQLIDLYPTCDEYASGANRDTQVVVLANFGGNVAEVATAMNLCFGMAGWLALFLHAVGVEIYVSWLPSLIWAPSLTHQFPNAVLLQLRLTPRESERLRAVSYQRQLEAGYKNPGNGGLTPQRIGDANEYVPRSINGDRKISGFTMTNGSGQLYKVSVQPEVDSIASRGWYVFARINVLGMLTLLAASWYPICTFQVEILHKMCLIMFEP